MSSVYSRQLLTLHDYLGSLPLTADPGFVTVIRDIDAWCNNGSIGEASFYAIGASDNIFAFGTVATGNTSLYSWRGRQVLNPGDAWQILTQGEGWDVTISGYVLSP